MLERSLVGPASRASGFGVLIKPGGVGRQVTFGAGSGKCRSVVQGGPERSWSTKGGCSPRGPPGPLRSILIHTF